MKMKIWFSFTLFLSLLYACEEVYTPKQKGYFRIDLPENTYQNFENDCPFSFQYSNHAIVKADNNPNAEPCWLNIDYPKFKARIHLSYKKIDNNLNNFSEESRTLVYKHTVRANDIRENLIQLDSNKVYGIYYDLQGNAASFIQFHLTDSSKHFLRGSLYFNSRPNRDSLQPVLDFIQKDIQHFIETTKWK